MYSNFGMGSRRLFMKRFSAVAAGFTLGISGVPGSESNVSRAKSLETSRSGGSVVSFVVNKDQREASYQALKPLEQDIMNDIGDKQVMIKINMSQVAEKLWLNGTDANFVRGILDFLKPNYTRQVIIAESTAAAAGTMAGFENYHFMPLKNEYNIKIIDLNEEPYTAKWILGKQGHPTRINVINPFLDPTIYMISATRLKTHDNVIATLSFKNIAMASPLNSVQQKGKEGKNYKPLMHSSGNRELSYNLFSLGTIGIRPNLAVLDGVVGMEGNGPIRGTPVEQGVALASTDWVSADRLGVELMGIDYSEVKYLQWCSAAGMGTDNLSMIKIIGPDYQKHITKYKLNDNIDGQRKWIIEDYS